MTYLEKDKKTTGLSMKRSDKILLSVVFILALIGFAGILWLQSALSDDDAIAIVSYDNTPIMEIYLSDGDYTIIDPSRIVRADALGVVNDSSSPYQGCFEETNTYCVMGENGPVVIQYDNNRVSVIYETSPYNLCRNHGPTNSPARPITCLPNLVTIRIESQEDTDDAYIERRYPWIPHKQH